MNDITGAIERVPIWVWGIVLVVVIYAASRSSANNATNVPGVGSITTNSVIPADPNLTALAATQSNNATAAFESVANILGSEQIAALSAQRDSAIAALQADVQNNATAAQLSAAQAADSVQQTLGLATVNNELQAALDAGVTARANTQAAKDVNLATVAAQSAAAAGTNATNVTLADINAKTQTTLGAQQENASKSASKASVWSSIGNAVSALSFGLL